MTFAGKTMFISGASRGIGLAIAKRVAADGANIALVAKTTEPHPRLKGTIYTAADAEDALAEGCRGQPGQDDDLEGEDRQDSEARFR